MSKCLNCGASIDAPAKLCKRCTAIFMSRPCNGCTDRTTTCHSTCERYLESVRVRKVVQKLRIDIRATYKNKY